MNEGGGCAGYFFQRRFMKAHLKREDMRRCSRNGHRNKAKKSFLQNSNEAVRNAHSPIMLTFTQDVCTLYP